MPPSSRLRRFHNSLTDNQRWIRERSHESYAKNYSVVFPFDEPLASRNMRKDPFHQVDEGFDVQSRRLDGCFSLGVQGNNTNVRLSCVSPSDSFQLWFDEPFKSRPHGFNWSVHISTLE